MQDMSLHECDDMGSKVKNLDNLVTEFEGWQQAHTDLMSENMNLQGELKELQKQQLDNKDTNQQLKNDTRQLQEQIDKLHSVLKTRCDVQTENRTLKLELESMREASAKQAHESVIQFERLQDHFDRTREQHEQELKDLKGVQSAQAAVDKATYEQHLGDKTKEILNLQQRMADIEKENHAEIVKLRLEYDAKLLKLQKQTNRVQQNAAASSNQEIFRKKLQHAKSEYEREICGLKRTISDLSSQVSMNNSGNSSSKIGQLQLKKRKF